MFLCNRGPSEGEQLFYVVDEVNDSDFNQRSCDPDGAIEQAHPILLHSEYMLDARADFLFRVVGPPDRPSVSFK
jgi:hypothetical protein